MKLQVAGGTVAAASPTSPGSTRHAGGTMAMTMAITNTSTMGMVEKEEVMTG